MGMTHLRVYGQTIGEYLKGDHSLGTADPERVELLRAVVWQRLNDPQSPDPIRVFVKSEPHKQSKLDSGRYRLISAVSFVDTMTDRIMLRWLQNAVLDSLGSSSCMVGASPLDGGYRWISGLFKGRKTRALDMTAWDWTIPEWLILALKDLVKNLALCHPQFWSDWLDRRWEALFRDAVFCFGDGSTVRQPGWGLMKSGCYLTIVLNTFSQMIRHRIVMSRLGLRVEDYRVVFLGDDQTIEDFPQFGEYERITRSMGFLLKESEVSEHAVHFIGYVMTRDSMLPEYSQKHVFKITHVPDDVLADVLESFCILYAQHDLSLIHI